MKLWDDRSLLLREETCPDQTSRTSSEEIRSNSRRFQVDPRRKAQISVFSPLFPPKVHVPHSLKPPSSPSTPFEPSPSLLSTSLLSLSLSPSSPSLLSAPPKVHAFGGQASSLPPSSLLSAEIKSFPIIYVLKSRSAPF